MSEARRRSHWAWGYEDRFPTLDMRRGFMGPLSAMLGIAATDPKEARPLDAVTMSGPRIGAPSELAEISSTDRHDRAQHTRGQSFPDLVRGYGGDFGSAPDLVLRPRDEDDVERALAWASDANIALIPFGGGTSVVGGVELRDHRERYAGVASLDLGAMSGVVEIDEVSRSARIRGGTLGPAIEEGLCGRKLSMRCYPQSFEFSTLGGWIATRAGGHFATLYTHVDDLVESMRVVTPAGRIETRRLPGSGAGPSPDRFMLGSEGALGVITEAWVRVQARPTYRASASAKFSSWDQAVGAVLALSQSGLHPSNCRLLDAREALLNGVMTDGAHVLLIAFESHDHPLEPWIDRALQIADDYGGVHSGAVHRRGDGGRADESAGRWRSAFLDAPYLQSGLVTMGMVVDTFETACTWDRFDALHEALNENVTRAMREACGGGVLTCRFTHVYPDGPAPYYTFLAPGREGARLEQWAAIKKAASDTLIAQGATITHHHAVGRTHMPWYRAQRPALFGQVLDAAKRTLDPAGILNPGVLVERREG